MRRRPLVSCAAAAVLATTLGACGGEAAGGDWGDRSRAPIPAVEVVQARLDALPLRERLTGTVRGAGQVAIYPRASGAITEVYVEDGQVVREGQPLARIRSTASRSQLRQAEAALTEARAQARAARATLSELEGQLERTRLLARDSLVSQEALETEGAQVEAARASVEQAVARVRAAEATIDERADAVDRTVIRAPIPGVVGQREAEVGMLANGQTRLFTIGQLERVRVEVPIAQDLIGRVVTGQTAEIRTDADPDRVIRAEVSRLSPFLTEGSFSAEAEIDVDNPAGRLVPGMFVTVDVLYGESDSTTVVPVSALHDDVATGRTGVWTTAPPDTGAVAALADSGTGPLTEPVQTRFVPVEVLAEGRQTAAVTGIRPGDWVVVVGHGLLADETEATPRARIRPNRWDRIIRLQERQGPELLQELMEEHRSRTDAGRTAPGGAPTETRGT
jgi:HlyD family secretion protein